MFSATVCNPGDSSHISQTKEFVLNPFSLSSPLLSSTWSCRRQFPHFPTFGIPVPVYKSLVKPSFICDNQAYQSAHIHPILNQPPPTWFPKPTLFFNQNQVCSQRLSRPLYDASLPVGRQFTILPGSIARFSLLNMPKQNVSEVFSTASKSSVMANQSENELKTTEHCRLSSFGINEESSQSIANCSELLVESAATDKKSMQNSIEAFLQKIMELYDKLSFRDCMSSNQYKTFINNLLVNSRHYFYKLESVALCEILKENDDWEETSCVADIFHHEYFSMADILSIYLLQLILAFNEFGFVNVDSVGSDSSCILSFYRGEFRLGRVLPGVYQMHVTSYQYTACTKMLQVTDNCPLLHSEVHNCPWVSNGDIEADIQHWSMCNKCDPFHVDDSKLHFCDNQAAAEDSVNKTSDVESIFKIEDASNLLKMLCWRVHFVQNPDLEEESYYLCCKAIKPYLQEPEYIFQSDSFKYFFGKMVSPKLNFTNPTLDEITLNCRPYGQFEVLHSFGHHLPLYSIAVGILVDYLRHKRFKRTVF